MKSNCVNTDLMQLVNNRRNEYNGAGIVHNNFEGWCQYDVKRLIVVYSVLRRCRDVAVQTERKDTVWKSTMSQTGKVRVLLPFIQRCFVVKMFILVCL